MSIQDRMTRLLGEAKSDEDAAATEVLSTRIEGKTVEEHVVAYLQKVIAEGQTLNGQVKKASEQVKGYYNLPQGISDRAMLKAFSKVVRDRWGDDAMTGPLTRLVALGDYIY